MGRCLDLYCGVLKVAIALCLLAMVILVFSNVVLRYIFNSGIATSEELSGSRFWVPLSLCVSTRTWVSIV